MSNGLVTRVDNLLDRLEARDRDRVSIGEPEEATFWPLHEVTEPSNLAFALSKVMDSNLPGFVIRKSDSLTADGQAPQDVITETLDELGFSGFESGDEPSPVFFMSAHDGTLGEWTGQYTRHDPWFVNTLNMNTVEEGRGLIAIGEAGPHYREVWRHVRNRGTDAQIQFWRELSEHLQVGNTHPRVMSTDVHWAEVEPGDTMVFPDSNRNGPLIHRLDTLPYLPYKPEEDERLPITWHPYTEQRAWVVRDKPAARDIAYYGGFLLNPTDRFANLRGAAKNALLTPR